MLQVTYASKPQAAGGPFLRSAPGKLIFGKQQLRQTLTPVDSLVNSVSFKALNVFPGNAIQNAVIKTLSGTKYKVQPTFCVDYTQYAKFCTQRSQNSCKGHHCLRNWFPCVRSAWTSARHAGMCTSSSTDIVTRLVQLILQPAKIFGIQIGPSRNIERIFDVLYLDETVRVVEFLPNESPNSNSTDSVLFVMRRLSDVQRPQPDIQVS